MKLFCPECQARFEDETLQVCPHDSSKLFVLDANIPDPLIGKKIDDRFRVEQLIGRGGMGAVYKGTQLSVGRSVAIKVLRNELLDQEIALERFYRESKIISELSHPNIVRLIDFGQDRAKNLLYLVMELIDGVEVGTLIERGRFQLPLALEIVYQVCGALTEPHMRDVIHRDLKPDNLIAVPVSDGTLQIKVLDFGIARASEADAQITSTGMVCGTPQYMAPEQAQNLDMNPRTDLYSLGVIFYEMLCGTPPFSGQNSLQIMLQQIQVPPKRLAHYLPPSSLPEEVEALLYDMLAKNSLHRPESAREIRERIDRIRLKHAIEPVRLYPDIDQIAMFEPWIDQKIPDLVEEALQQAETGKNLSKPHTPPHAFEPTLDGDAVHATVPISNSSAHRIVEDKLDPKQKPISAIRKPEHPPTEGVTRKPTPPELGHVSQRPEQDTPQEQPAAAPKKSSVLLFGSAGAVFIGVLIAITIVVLILAFESKDTPEPQDPIIVEKVVEKRIPAPQPLSVEKKTDPPSQTTQNNDVKSPPPQAPGLSGNGIQPAKTTPKVVKKPTPKPSTNNAVKPPRVVKNVNKTTSKPPVKIEPKTNVVVVTSKPKKEPEKTKPTPTGNGNFGNLFDKRPKKDPKKELENYLQD